MSSDSRTSSSIPFILKGIATAEDAKIAVEHGIDVVYVSNHGGRQLDHGEGAHGRAAGDRGRRSPGSAEIIVDGGFCAAPTS